MNDFLKRKLLISTKGIALGECYGEMGMSFVNL